MLKIGMSAPEFTLIEEVFIDSLFSTHYNNANIHVCCMNHTGRKSVLCCAGSGNL